MTFYEGVYIQESIKILVFCNPIRGNFSGYNF